MNTSFRAYLRRLPRELLHGFLQAGGLRRIPPRVPPGCYWARDQLGRWELRVPATRTDSHPVA